MSEEPPEAALPHVGLADPGRWDDCRALWLALRDHHGAGDPEMGPLRGDEDSWARGHAAYGACLAEEGAFLVIAQDHGQESRPPLGCAIVTVDASSPTWDAADRFGCLEVISVLPEARGLGIGGRIMEVVQAELDRQGAGECRLTVMAGNLGAQAFYRELGFDTFSLNLRRPASPS